MFQSVIVRWGPPPKEECNGVITGYKLRYRARDRRGESKTVTTGGNRKHYLLDNLEKSSVSYLWCLPAYMQNIPANKTKP